MRPSVCRGLQSELGSVTDESQSKCSPKALCHAPTKAAFVATVASVFHSSDLFVMIVFSQKQTVDSVEQQAGHGPSPRGSVAAEVLDSLVSQ